MPRHRKHHDADAGTHAKHPADSSVATLPAPENAALEPKPGSRQSKTVEAQHQEQVQRLGSKENNLLEEEIEAMVEPIKTGVRARYMDHLHAQGIPLHRAAAPNHGSTGFCIHCDNPVAMGQNSLCREHIRTA